MAEYRDYHITVVHEVSRRCHRLNGVLRVTQGFPHLTFCVQLCFETNIALSPGFVVLAVM
jgi:hypothetical protein